MSSKPSGVDATWNYQVFVDKNEAYRVDGVYELAMGMLRRDGGQNWKSKLCQVDIVNIVVAATREYDRKA